MKLKTALLFLVILIAFFGCEKAEKQNYVNEINIGVIGSKQKQNNDSTYGLTFREYYKINLNTNKLLIVKNPSINSDIAKQAVSETSFNFSTDKRISVFIKFAKKYESISTFDFVKASSKITNTCWSPKIIYFEFNRGDYSKHYLFDLNNANSIVAELYTLAKQLSETKRITAVVNSIKIDQDSLFANDSANIKIIFQPPPPPVEKTIKYIPPVEEIPQ